MDRPDQVMHGLRDHPWSGASHVAGLTGIPLRSTQRYLAKLLDADLVQAKRVPMIQERLHAPSKRGIIRLAGGKQKARSYAQAFGLDAYHLAGTLLRAHALVWARDLLVQLATASLGGSLQWAVSPRSAHVGRRLLRLDGFGVCRWRGQYLRFGILADPGGLAVEGYVTAFEKFVRWAKIEEFSEVGQRPTLVMLTTYARRAQQLAVQWSDLVQKIPGASSLEMFVAVRGDVEVGPSRWWRAGTAGQGPLWRGCRGSRASIPHAQPSLMSPSGSTSVRIQDLGVWGRNRKRGRTLRDLLALSGKEYKVLHQVARWPLLRSTGLALLAGYSGNSAGMMSKMLQKLQIVGLIRAVRDSDAEKRLLELKIAQLKGRLNKTVDRASQTRLLGRLLNAEDELDDLSAAGENGSTERYVLSPRGLTLLAATRGMSPLSYAKARLWPAEYVESDGKRVVDLRIARFLLAWKHTLLTNEFFLGLRRLAEREQEMERNHQLLIWDSVECRRWFWDAGGRQLLLPDSGGVYRIGDEVYEFWLEIDRGHSVAGKHGKALRRKYERYYLYRRHPNAIWGRSMPRVLVVTPQIGRARQVKEMIMSLAEERGEPPLPVYITTLDDIWLPAKKQSDGTLRPCRKQAAGLGRLMEKRMWPGLPAWRPVAKFQKLVYCFEGLGHAPSGTQRALDLGRLRREVRAHTHRSAAQRKRRQRK
jgi:hypothetical protein